MKQKRKPMRQGDVLILPVNKIPNGLKNFKKTKRVTLALGEATGHHHTIYTDAIGYASSIEALAEYFEVTGETADLTHQEHGTIPIPKGKWRNVIQTEYTPEELKKVVD